MKARRRASVPELTARAVRAERSFRHSSSKASTSGPMMNCPLASTRSKAALSSPSIADMSVGLSGADQHYTDALRADRRELVDLDMLTIGQRTMLPFSTETFAVGLVYELSLPVSTGRRSLYPTSSIDLSGRVVASV